MLSPLHQSCAPFGSESKRLSLGARQIGVLCSSSLAVLSQMIKLWPKDTARSNLMLSRWEEARGVSVMKWPDAVRRVQNAAALQKRVAKAQALLWSAKYTSGAGEFSPPWTDPNAAINFRLYTIQNSTEQQPPSEFPPTLSPLLPVYKIRVNLYLSRFTRTFFDWQSHRLLLSPLIWNIFEASFKSIVILIP